MALAALLLAVQPLLIRWRRQQSHRLFDRAGVLVGLTFIGVGVLMAHQGLNLMTPEQRARDGRDVHLPLAIALVFASALALALRWRGTARLHAWYLAATTLSLLDPVLARLLYAHGPALPREPLYQPPACTVAFIALLAMARSLPLTLTLPCLALPGLTATRACASRGRCKGQQARRLGLLRCLGHHRPVATGVTVARLRGRRRRQRSLSS